MNEKLFKIKVWVENQGKLLLALITDFDLCHHVGLSCAICSYHYGLDY